MTLSLYAANTLIVRANECHTSMSHLKLQKMLYILYARFLAVSEKSLFADRFMAWRYGPALSEIYQTFKGYGASDIKEPVAGVDGKMWVLSEVGDFGLSFKDAWERYGYYTAADLVDITHEDSSAWSKAKNENGLGSFLKDEYIKHDGKRWFS